MALDCNSKNPHPPARGTLLWSHSPDVNRTNLRPFNKLVEEGSASFQYWKDAGGLGDTPKPNFPPFLGRKGDRGLVETVIRLSPNLLVEADGS